MLTVRVSWTVVVPVALVAVIKTGKVPGAVGAPLMTPVALFTTRPGGNPLAL